MIGMIPTVTKGKRRRKPTGGRHARRRVAVRPLRSRVLVVCEGRVTETAYLNELRKNFRLTATVVIETGSSDPLNLVNDAIDARDAGVYAGREYDEVWCVFDTEAPKPHATLEDALKEAATAELFVARSNPCFELWLLLHLEDHNAHLTTKQAGQALRRAVTQMSSKSIDRRTFLRLANGIPDAVRRSAQLAAQHEADGRLCPHDNPSSGVGPLVGRLIG